MSWELQLRPWPCGFVSTSFHQDQTPSKQSDLSAQRCPQLWGWANTPTCQHPKLCLHVISQLRPASQEQSLLGESTVVRTFNSIGKHTSRDQSQTAIRKYLYTLLQEPFEIQSTAGLSCTSTSTWKTCVSLFLPGDCELLEGNQHDPHYVQVPALLQGQYPEEEALINWEW